MTNSDHTLQQLRIIELEALVKALEEENTDLHDADRKNTTLILEMSEQADIERKEIKTLVNNLSLYLNIEAV